MSKKILVTGGTGYIGSHTVVQLLNANYQVLILDNLSNSKIKVLDRINSITSKLPDFIQGDILDSKLLSTIFSENKIDSVIHFAGLKAVGESQSEPIKYYQNNVSGSLTLFESMLNAGVNKLIFSSSATVYGDPGYAKCAETTPLNPQSVYGDTKKVIEDIINSISKANKEFNFGILRYFNPVGAHESGLIGEDPNGIPNNLVPFISQVASGKLAKLMVWGNDYSTADGTGRRDYIHVEDLAAGHLAALKALDANSNSFTVNLGTGNSYSVLEVIDAFEKTSGKKINYEIGPRRSGDVAESYADPSLAAQILSWQAKYDLTQMCADAWNWQSKNPNGYV